MKKKNDSKLILITSLFLLIGFISGYYLGLNNSNNSDQDIKMISSEINHWKTIEAEDYRFKVPQDWQELSPYNNQAHFFKSPTVEVSFYRTSKSTNKTLEESWQSGLMGSGARYDRTKYIVFYQDGKKVLLNNPEKQQVTYVIELNDSETLVIPISERADLGEKILAFENNSQLIDLLNKVLSTFSFTD